jgi:hypothetical protein
MRVLEDRKMGTVINVTVDMAMIVSLKIVLLIFISDFGMRK